MFFYNMFRMHIRQIISHVVKDRFDVAINRITKLLRVVPKEHYNEY
ncbi:6027_t:CDS:2 [Paraglomus occultum]|uniref:6027_t:CDS:1 n=1 Tax=Paraglomus occultum TaxID=144539 RepID=A0A9N9FDK1_9GLOM|nr:6027_t:CDS:2 [Paraglomus occultum]